MGRTHSVHAEPITFGLKLASWAFELDRDRTRLAPRHGRPRDGQALRAGRHLLASSLRRSRPEAWPSSACRSTRSARRSCSATATRRSWLRSPSRAARIERFATEVRNLQHTEIAELQEPFRAGQKGSSAMPHKRNPITSERLVGLARLLRGFALAGMEDQALWHERDISHSSVERVALPGATTLLHYMLVRFRRLVDGLVVRPERMRENIERGLGLHASSRLLTALVESGGLSREDAYAHRPAQRAARRGRAAAAARAGDGRPGGRRGALAPDQIAACFDESGAPARGHHHGPPGHAGAAHADMRLADA